MLTCDGTSWKRPEVFDWIQQAGGIDTHEMFRTFNCGVGMIAAIPSDKVDAALKSLKESGETAWVLGEIKPVAADGAQVTISGI